MFDVQHVVSFSLLCLQEAGADASYVEGPRSIEELKEIGKRQKVHSTECGCIAAYDFAWNTS